MIASTKKKLVPIAKPATKFINYTSVKFTVQNVNRTEIKVTKCIDSVINRLIVTRGHPLSTCSSELSTINIRKHQSALSAASESLMDELHNWKHTHTFVGGRFIIISLIFYRNGRIRNCIGLSGSTKNSTKGPIATQWISL